MEYDRRQADILTTPHVVKIVGNGERRIAVSFFRILWRRGTVAGKVVVVSEFDPLPLALITCQSGLSLTLLCIALLCSI